MRLLHSLGSHADANSLGEVDVAMRCGFRPDQIVFTGVGKSAAEIDRAVALGLLAINVESPGELDRIDQRAVAQGTRGARGAARQSRHRRQEPSPHLHRAQVEQVRRADRRGAGAVSRDGRRAADCTPVGAHVHIGSQITTLDPLTRAAEAVVALAHALRDEGIELQHLDMGGGLGISYDGGPVVDPAEYVRALVAATRGQRPEGGDRARPRAGRARRRAADPRRRREAVSRAPSGSSCVDAGMTELMRPALYNAYHRIEPVVRAPASRSPVDIVGPICESTDAYARDRLLPPVEVGDLVVVRDVGAYGAAMGHTYLRRPLPPEVLVDGDEWRIIRRRQTLDELLSLETNDRRPQASGLKPTGSLDRLRRARSKRQADPGGAAARGVSRRRRIAPSS